MEAHLAPAACNQALIVGELVQVPETRDLPSGSSLISFSLTVRIAGQKTTSVPLTWFDPPKRAHRWRAGDGIVALGSVVRRFYRAGGSTGSRTEVEVARAETVASSKRASSLVATATASLLEIEAGLAPPGDP